MNTTHNPAITAAAHRLAQAEAQATEAARQLSDALAHQEKVAARVASLEEKRAAIVSRRAAGQEHPEDGPSLALLSADLDGLSALASAATAEVSAARGPYDAAQGAVSAARYVLQCAEDEAAEAALVQHADRLAALLTETNQQLAALAERLGRPAGTFAWSPSKEFYGDMRRRAAVAGML